MKNVHNKSEQLWQWLCQGAVRHIGGHGDEFNDAAADDLFKVFNNGDEDEITAFFNALCFTDHESEEMLGYQNTLDIFKKTNSKYPDLCKVLVIYIYS